MDFIVELNSSHPVNFKSDWGALTFDLDPVQKPLPQCVGGSLINIS